MIMNTLKLIALAIMVSFGACSPRIAESTAATDNTASSNSTNTATPSSLNEENNNVKALSTQKGENIKEGKAGVTDASKTASFNN